METIYYKARPDRYRIIQLGILAFVMYLLAVFPFFITRGLPFFYYGDYNVQQIPFYIQAHRAVRNGDLFWNWNVDFGVSMIGSFSFYLLGSPFFWITIPFSESVLPYIMPFLMALKYSVCAMTSYAYIRRHVIRDQSAMIGAILYAFSGFNGCNIVFNHFTDVVAFFPLYLITFDKLMEIDHHKDHWFFIPAGKEFVSFTLMTAFMAVLNYYFFYGEVVFLFLYFAVCYLPGNRRMQQLRMFARALLGGLLGCSVSGFYTLQAMLAVSGNDRITETLSGYDLVSYPSMNMLWDIVKSMVMIPDIIGKGTVFYTQTVRVSSLAVYLPVFGISGVVAYFLLHKNKRDNLVNLLSACLIISFIPILNSAFSFFNSAYYARWFYMPILFMALATAKVVERGRTIELRKGVLATAFTYIFILLISVMPSYDENGKKVFCGLIENEKIYKRQIIGTAILLILLIMTVYVFPKCIREIKIAGKNFKLKRPILRLHALLAITLFGAVLSNYLIIKSGSGLISDYGKEQWQLQMLDTKPELEGDEFFRGETDNTATNYDMVWGIPSLHSFISTISSKTFDFLEGAAGINRTVETRIPENYVGLRAILSQKYYIENDRINDDGIFNAGDGIEGFLYVNSQNGLDIYLNKNYIRMGIPYDYYIRQSDFDAIPEQDIKDRILSIAVVISDLDADALGDSLTELPAGYYTDVLPLDIFEQNCADLNSLSCETFLPDTRGFYARTANLDSKKLLFFSVPNEKGFTVKIDGKPTKIINADYGMIGVLVEGGVHEIRADYIPDGFYPGMVISFVGILILVLYLVGVNFYKKRQI